MNTAHDAVLELGAPHLGLLGLPSKHLTWEIYVEAVGWRIGTVVIAKLALVTEIQNVICVARGKFLSVAIYGVGVQPFKHEVERWAEAETTTTAIADVKYLGDVLLELRGAPKGWVARGRNHIAPAGIGAEQQTGAVGWASQVRGAGTKQ